MGSGDQHVGRPSVSALASVSAPTPALGRVVVIGGGLAGISAALGAADGGASVTLLERRRRLGGLTWSFHRKGHQFDNGQHVFLRCCTAYRSMLARIGASDQVRLQERMRIPVLAPGGRRADLWRTGWPAPLHLLPSLARYSHLSLGDRMGVARGALALSRLDREDPALDEKTFGAWLAEHHQSRQSVECLWDLLTVPTVNLPAAEASLALAATVFQIGLLERSDAGDVGWSEVPLSTLHGENAERALDATGVDVRTAVRAMEVRRGGRGGRDERWVVEIEGEPPLTADVVVVATPPRTAAHLLGDGALPPVGRLGTSPIVNVHLLLDRRVTDLPMAAAVGSPIQYVFDRTETSGLERGQCLAVSLSAADALIGMRPKALVASVVHAVQELLPSAGRAEIVDAVVTRERSATFRGVPGTARFRPGSRTSLDGVFVAGAWCRTGWPATMEGAVRSGQAAASAALDHLDPGGHHPGTVQPSLEEANA